MEQLTEESLIERAEAAHADDDAGATSPRQHVHPSRRAPRIRVRQDRAYRALTHTRIVFFRRLATLPLLLPLLPPSATTPLATATATTAAFSDAAANNASTANRSHDPRLTLPLPDGTASLLADRRLSSLAASSERLEALMQQLPNQTELMLRLVTVAGQQEAELAARNEALLVLQELVEDLDKAHDFAKLPGGYAALVALLAEPALQEAAAWALGTAAQNQRELQLHMLGLQALPALLNVVRSAAAPVAVRAKALYASAALLRNCPEAQWAFVRPSIDGIGALLDAVESGAPRLARKARRRQ